MCSGGEWRGRKGDSGSWAEVGAGQGEQQRQELRTQSVAGEFEEERGVKGKSRRGERLVRPALLLTSLGAGQEGAFFL